LAVALLREGTLDGGYLSWSTSVVSPSSDAKAHSHHGADELVDLRFDPSIPSAAAELHWFRKLASFDQSPEMRSGISEAFRL
jgi:hypothetical protein